VQFATFKKEFIVLSATANGSQAPSYQLGVSGGSVVTVVNGQTIRW
jgi:hypothetical protein